MPQPQSRQQSRLSDIQMLQRQIMFKQFQELQRQQQLQDLGGDGRQQTYLNQPSSRISKQAPGPQYPSFVNGTPIHDPTQMFMVNNLNLVQRNATPVVQGFPNGLAFPQAQTQGLGLMTQQLDGSLYGTPVGSPGNNLSYYSHIHEESHDPPHMFIRNETEKPIMQSSSLRNSFVSDQFGMRDGGFLSKQVVEERDLFGQVPSQDLKSEVLSETSKQEQGGWPGLFPGKTTSIAPSQGLDSLDPLEQKILFSMDDNSWDSSFGERRDTEAGGFDNIHTDNLNSFPSVQSGSWSALMQSAVAEASSSDTGVQEEWSGLSFQNQENSTDNQHSSYMASGKQPSQWVDSKSEVFNNSITSFPGFQQPGIEFPIKHSDGLRSYTSHESVQHSPKHQGNWLDCNSQLKQPNESGQPVQKLSLLQSSLPGQNYDHLESSTRLHNLGGDVNNTAYKSPASMWKSGENDVALFFSNSEPNLHVAQGHHLDYMKNVDVPDRGMNLGHYQHHPITYKGGTGTEKRENSFQRENSIDSYHSNASQNTITGHEVRETARLHESDSRTEAEGGPKPSIQVPHGPRYHDQVHVGQFKHGTVSYSGMESDKGHLSNTQRNIKESEHFPSRSNVESTTTPFFERSPNFHRTNMNSQTSQNMLELLHKVDKSSEFKPKMHFGTTSSNSSEVPQPESYANSSASECFGLRLAPPSQHLPNPKCFDSSQSSPQIGNDGSTLSSGPFVRNQLQNQHLSSAPLIAHQAQQTAPGRGRRFSDFSPASQDETHLVYVETNDHQKFPFSLKQPNMWRNASTQQNMSGKEPQIPFNMRPSPDSTNSNQDKASVTPLESHSQNYFEGGTNLQAGDLSHGQEPVASGTLLTNTQSSEVSARDLEAFGRSLKPAYVPPQNYSLKHQVQSMKNVENDPSGSTVAVKHNAVDCDTSVQQVTSVAGQQLYYGHIEASNRGEQSNINLQTAPSWSNHYGTLRNGQMLSVHDARAAFMNATQQLSIGKSYETMAMNSSMVQNVTGPSQVGSVWPTTATASVATTDIPLPHPSNQKFIDQKLAIMKSKKRKFDSFKLLPWHKEVTQGSQRLHDISMTDQEWAHAANRLIEKVEHYAEMIEDALPMHRPKKRLITTTSLMQQLFRPAPPIILSENASLNPETMAYFSARLAMGDACSMTTNSRTPSCISNKTSEEPNPSDEKFVRQKFSKVVEEFTKRSKKLEDEFLRLENSVSILDARIESQEIERFSIINRFAKFHIRGQVAVAETSTSSTPLPAVPKTFPQRYVTGIPMPSIIPEHGQCISL